MTLYDIERLLYRLAQSPYANHFILKGALLFLVWAIPGPRPTRDLEFPSTRLRIYSMESVIAEKLHAMVILDLTNRRMKDFYDLWTLSRLFPFSGQTLAQVIQRTFARRQTPIPTTTPTALTPVFGNDPGKITQWHAFLNRNRLAPGGAPFPQIIADLQTFLRPSLQALAHQTLFTGTWAPPEEWT